MRHRTRLLASLALALALAGCALPGDAQPSTVDGAGGFSGHPTISGTYRFHPEFSRVLHDGPNAILPDEVVKLTSARDGAAIQLAVVRPDVPAGARVPIIAWMSPYLKDLATTPVAAQDGMGGHVPLGDGVDGGFLVENFVPHGYAVAAIAMRGSAGSGGCQDVMGPATVDDLEQALDWLAEQPWSTGAIGAYGLSYEGLSQWAVAARGHPALKTIVPVGTINDVWKAVHRNGTINNGPLVVPAYVPTVAATYRQPAEVTGMACADLLPATASAATTTLVREQEPFETRWRERAFRAGVEQNYDGSVLLVHGWHDATLHPRNAYPWVSGLGEHGIVVKHVVAPWGHTTPDSPHAPERRMDWAQTLLRWYDHWLKGDAAAELGPRVEVADTSWQWRAEDAWPPADARETVLYLSAARTLEASPADARESFLVAPEPARTFAPLEARLARTAPCASCVAFRTATLAEELRFAGLPQVHVTVTPLGPRGYLTATLLAESATDARTLTSGIFDLRNASEPVTPGQPLLLPMELEPTDAVVHAGERLILVLAQGGYGSAATYHGGQGGAAPVRIEVGGETSVVRLATFERPAHDARFFAPPGAQP